MLVNYIATTGDLPTPASKAYLFTFEVKKHAFEIFFGNGTLHVCNTCSKDLLHRTRDGALLTNGKSDK